MDHLLVLTKILKFVRGREDALRWKREGMADTLLV